MSDRIKANIAVFIAVFNDRNEVLLMKRANTGYMDGYYDFPSGHLEQGESLDEAALRELEEETSLKAMRDDLKMFHTYMHYEPDKTYFGAMFILRKFEGKPVIAEPDKCDDISWYSLEDLPKVTFQVASGLKNIDSGAVVNTVHR